jgi:hypothetical protein
MSRLAEFRQLEKHLAEQMAALEAMKSNGGIQKEIEFETKLRNLLAEYGFSLRDIIALLDPQAAHRASASVQRQPVTRKPRVLKVYKNPNTGEIVETKGGNHSTLKEWKAEYGADIVESWRSQ